MEEKYPTFLYSYPFAGKQWSFDLPAKDGDEAAARLLAIRNYAKLDGQLHLSIYIPDPRGPWRRFLSRAREAYRAFAHRESP